MKALQLIGYGDPARVVKLVDLPDVGAPGPDEIVIDVEAVPVEPSDLYIIAGIYGNQPPLGNYLEEERNTVRGRERGGWRLTTVAR